MKIIWFDVETSGTDEKKHQIIQLAAVVTVDGEVADTLDVRVKFDPDKADPEALKVNGYSEELWQDAVSEREMVRKFSHLLGRYLDLNLISRRGKSWTAARLAGHNVKFDTGFLIEAFRRYGVFLQADVFRALDTLQLALWDVVTRGLRPPVNYQLGTLLDYYEVDHDPEALHNALTDTLVTAALGLKIMGRPSCRWAFDDDCEAWETECGGRYLISEGTPTENRMGFCPYCGWAIDEAPVTADGGGSGIHCAEDMEVDDEQKTEG